MPHSREVTLAKYRPVGERSLWTEEDKPEETHVFKPCDLLQQQMVIGFDGQVGLCCEDIHLDVPYGDVHDKSLLDIYNNSPIIRKYRQAHEQEVTIKGSISDLTLCKDCDVWASSIILSEQKINLDGVDILKKVTS